MRSQLELHIEGSCVTAGVACLSSLHLHRRLLFCSTHQFIDPSLHALSSASISRHSFFSSFHSAVPAHCLQHIISIPILPYTIHHEALAEHIGAPSNSRCQHLPEIILSFLLPTFHDTMSSRRSFTVATMPVHPPTCVYSSPEVSAQELLDHQATCTM